MRKQIIISGLGGQGIILAGNILCYSSMKEDKYVTLVPSYGAEMRGGTANCQIIISDEYIGSPIVKDIDILLSFNKPSYDRFSSKVSKNGIIFANSSLYKPNSIADVGIVEIPGNELAAECGSILTLNMVMLGALVAKTKIIAKETLLNAIPEILTKRKEKFWEINKKALETGFDFVGEK
jgi:2-oxoglutarate ferredoxin oxidoreductase subunit gamma